MRRLETESLDAFPFSVPVIRSLTELTFTTPVTFFVGENGSGKSTLLEALAVAAALPVAGSDHLERDPTLDRQRSLAKALRLSWSVRTHRGFFLRAEDFFGFAKSTARLRSDLHARLEEIVVEYEGRSALARTLAEGPIRASLGELERRYGAEVDGRSHGEAFLHFFQARFVPSGLYLLDEPEAPLSPQSQLALLAMLHEMVAERSQFIIATHSPILLAFPGARIYSFDGGRSETVAYTELDHVNLTRSFLNDPARYIRHLMAREGARADAPNSGESLS